MINKDLEAYMRKTLAEGFSFPVITQKLLEQGWKKEDIDECYLYIMKPMPVSPPKQVLTQDVHSGFGPGENTVKSSSRFRNPLLVVVITILVLLAGGAVYAYQAGYFVSLPRVTNAAFNHTHDAKSVTFDTTITIDASEMKDKGAIDISELFDASGNHASVTLKGSYDLFDPNNLKSTTSISFNGGMSAAFDFLTDNGFLYTRMTKAPTISFIPVLSSLENKWISFPYKSKEKVSEIPLPGVATLNSSLLEKLTDEQKAKIYQITENAEFITITKKLSPEVVGGETSYHFTFDLNRAGIRKYLQDLKDYVRSIGKDDSYLSTFDPTTFGSDLDKITDFTGEAWIGRKDGLPHKVTTSFSILSGSDQTGKVKISFAGIFSNWNKPVTVEVPKESMTFDELLNQLFSGSLSAAKDRGADAGVKYALRNMGLSGEMYYESHLSYLNFCKTAEVSSVQSSITSANPDSKLSCRDAKQTWAVAANLTDGTFFCVDSTGFAQVVNKVPVGTNCEK